MLALLALIAFVIALAVHGVIHGYVFWMLLGFAFLAASLFLDFLGWDRVGSIRRNRAP